MSFKLIAGAFIIILIVGSVFDSKIDFNKKSDEELIDFYRMKAMRIHGYDNFNKIEKLMSFKSLSKTKNPELFLDFYKLLVNTKKDDFDDVYKKFKKENDKKRSSEGSSKEWVCPEGLEGDTSDSAKHVKRILELSNDMDPSKMTKRQLKSYLCGLLDIDSISTEAIIKAKYKIAIVLIHPDKITDDAKNDVYTKAFQALRPAWVAYR